MTEFVSIVIATHNRAGMLQTTLSSLAGLVVPSGLEVELVVVANACTDETPEVAERFAQSWGHPARCVVEAETGLSVARNCGVGASSGSIVAMLDDDVWVDPSWLEGLVEVYQKQPADIVAGRVLLRWEGTERPPWFTPRIERCLSMRDHGLEIRELFRPGDALGANYSFRRSLYGEIGGFRRGLGRTGTALLGGEEVDFTLRALRRGARMFYAPRGLVGHFVSPERVTPRYLCDLARGSARSKIYVDPDWTRFRAVAQTLSGLSLFLSSFPAAAWNRMRGKEGARVEALIRRDRGLGRMRGSIDRLVGRSPV